MTFSLTWLKPHLSAKQRLICCYCPLVLTPSSNTPWAVTLHIVSRALVAFANGKLFEALTSNISVSHSPQDRKLFNTITISMLQCICIIFFPPASWWFCMFTPDFYFLTTIKFITSFEISFFFQIDECTAAS